MTLLQRCRPLLALVGLLAAEIGLVTTLHRLGSLPWLAVDWADLLAWAWATPPEDALAAAVRLATLAAAWWVLGSTLLCVAARMARVPALVRAVDWATLPAVRRLADGSVALALSASVAIGGAGPAVAAQGFR
ncbi:MAG: hypothetical protein ACRDU8_00380, partial [Egibacteraceae bacterium]